MRHSFVLRLLLVLLLGSLYISCESSNHTTSNGNVNAQGTWTAPVTFQSCTPADACASTGFTVGTSVNATMVLTQSNSQVQGTFTYQNTAGISAPVSGGVAGDQLTLTGTATTNFGTVTVNVAGTVSGNTIAAAVTHQVTLPSGSTANVSGSAVFTLQ